MTSSPQARERASFGLSVSNASITIGAALLAGLAVGGAAAEQEQQALIDEALSAAPPQVAETATVQDWDGTVLREGSGDFTCLPTPPPVRDRGLAPMCLDAEWMAWLDAYLNKNENYRPSEVGIGYMLRGDAGTSNIDPFAEAPTPDNQWVVEGPHLMVLLPEASQLEAVSDDPQNGGPYVMFPNTPYAHIMIPTAERPEQETAATAPQQ